MNWQRWKRNVVEVAVLIALGAVLGATFAFLWSASLPQVSP